MTTRKISNLKLSQIKPDPNQPRKTFDQDSLNGLAESIKTNGLIQPITVRKDGKKFMIVAGERRFRAVKLLKLPTIESIISEFQDEAIYEIQLIENLQRKDVEIIEESEGIAYLCKTASADEVGKRLGRSTTFIYQRLKLANLIDGFKALLKSKELTISYALQIGTFDQKEQVNILEVLGENFYEHQLNNILNAQSHNLANAPFELKDENLLKNAPSCNTCPSNSINNGNLFGDEKMICTGSACYALKKQVSLLNLVEFFKKENVKVVLDISNYSLDNESTVLVTNLLAKHKFSIDTREGVKIINEPTEPTKPIKPTLKSVREDSNPELGKDEIQAEFDEQMEYYDEELDDYKVELEEYNDDLAEYKETIKNALKCYLFNVNKYSYQTVYYRDNEIASSIAQSTVDKKMNDCNNEEKILKIKNNEARKVQIQTNGLFQQYTELVDKETYINQETPLTAEELKSACISMFSKCVNWNEKEKLFKGFIGNDSNLAKQYKKVKSSEQMLNKLIRYVIADTFSLGEQNHQNNLVNMGYYNALLPTHKEQFEDADKGYNERKTKREQRIDERIEELQKE